MTQLKFTPLFRSDGVYVRVDGFSLPFRFRLGSGSGYIYQTTADEIFGWHVEGDVGTYAIQLVPHTVTAEPDTEALTILSSHFNWENNFVPERLGVTLDENSVRVLQHVEGTPVLTWINQIPEPKLPAPVLKATNFAAHATMLHQPDHLLHFAITGFGLWAEDELQWQVLRAALSYFPLKDSDASTTT